MRFRYGKPDTTQAEIVAYLRGIGCTVEITSAVGRDFPDLVVGFCGRTFLVECKTTNGKLSAGQRAWHTAWRGGPVITATSGEEAHSKITDSLYPYGGTTTTMRKQQP